MTHPLIRDKLGIREDHPMISRFFKKKPKAAEKKAAPEKSRMAPLKEKPTPPRRLLTAEGWKRMMMRKSGKGKK